MGRVTCGIDFHYKSAPDVDSGIYDVVHTFRLLRTGLDWRIVSVESDNEDFQRFKKEVLSRTNSHLSVRGAADMVRQERVADLPVLARQLKAVEGKSPTVPGDSDASPGLSFELLAASFSYYASNGATYAQRFAEMPQASRFFYTAPGNDCTNFVSQCV